jgi:hypothetical protein
MSVKPHPHSHPAGFRRFPKRPEPAPSVVGHRVCSMSDHPVGQLNSDNCDSSLTSKDTTDVATFQLVGADPACLQTQSVQHV